MIDYRLKVFRAVATNFSFTKAAQELYISQPAVSKHIQELETEYKTRLFDRSNGRVTLTKAGQLLYDYSETIMAEYKKMDFAMNALRGKYKGRLNVGCSTTIANYVIPSILIDFIKEFPDMEIVWQVGNSAEIESQLLSGKIDIGLVESIRRHANIKYSTFMNDELVAIARADHNIPDEITLEQLSQHPLILREHGSGTLEVIEHHLGKNSHSLSGMNVLVQLSTTEIIKRVVEESQYIGIVSVMSIAKELKSGSLKIIDIKGVDMTRGFMFVERPGEKGGSGKLFKQYFLRKITSYRSTTMLYNFLLCLIIILYKQHNHKTTNFALVN